MATTDHTTGGNDAAVLVAALVERNVDNLARTTDLIIAGKDAEIDRYRDALSDVLLTVADIPPDVRSVTLDRLVTRYFHMIEEKR